MARLRSVSSISDAIELTISLATASSIESESLSLRSMVSAQMMRAHRVSTSSTDTLTCPSRFRRVPDAT